MTYDLRGRTVLITGAGRGIGAALARCVHERGASVALLDVHADSVERSAAATGERAIGLAADVTDWGALAAAVEATVARFGGIDVCVANAGIANQAATLRAIDPATFERVVEVNLLGVWRTVRASMPHVLERQGHFVLVSSIYAYLNGALVSPYAASKAGVEALGRALHAELAPSGATASVAYFGLVATEMVRQGIDEDPLGRRAKALVPFPYDRRISPERAAEAVVRGIERRAPRIVAPRRWVPLGALRGLVNPLVDRQLGRAPVARDLMTEADDPDRPGPAGTVGG